MKKINKNTKYSSEYYIDHIDAFIKNYNKNKYQEELAELKDENGNLNLKYGKWSPDYDYNRLINRLKEIMKYYDKDGKDIYEVFVSEIQSSNYPMEIKQQLLNEIRKDLFPSVSEDKEIPPAKTSIEYIMEYPERIITDITKENYRNKKELSIYDLNEEELKAYKKSMENLIKKAERNLNTKNNSSELTKGIKILTFEEWFKNQR